MNKINIALSEWNNSKNIEWRIESGSMHEITISSKTNEKVRICKIYFYNTIFEIESK